MTETETVQRPLAALIENRAKENETETESILKAFLKAKEDFLIAEKRLEALKVDVEAIRATAGEKKVLVNGKFKNQKGQFIITQIKRVQRTISVSKAEEVLSPELFAMLLNETPVVFNQVRFSVGRG